MKKILISLITLILIMAITFPVNAANTGNIEISISNSEVEPGEEFYVTVTASDANNLNTIEYTGISITDENGNDYTKIAQKSVERIGEDWAEYTEDESTFFVYSGSEKITAKKQVFKATFKVEDDVEDGKYKINILGLKVYSTNLTDDTTVIGTKSVDITVKAAEGEPDEPSDTTAPVGTIRYNPSTITSGSVTATITFNEANVTITNNGGSNTYTFTENGSFTFRFKDAAGNEGTATAKVDWIQQEVQGTTIPVNIKGVEKGTIKFYHNEMKEEKEITDYVNDKYLKAGEKIIAKVEIEDYLFVGIDNSGNEVKLSGEVDKKMYPALKIGEYYFTPISAERDEEKNKTTLVYEFKNEDPNQEEVLSPNIELDFTINNEGKALFMYYSENKDTFNTENKLTKENNSGALCNILMNIDGIPYLSTEAYVEAKTESGRYEVGTPIIIDVTSSEELKDLVDPEIRVSFSKSGLGKYNYQEDATKGNAVLYYTDINEEGKTVWVYYYYIQDGDEGTLKIEYLSGKITDNADNTVDVTGVTLEEEKVFADTSAPVVNITAQGIQNSVTNANRITYILTFSEEVVGFTEEDIIVIGGTKGRLSTVTKNADGTYSYTLDVTVDTLNGNHGEVRVILEQGACKDVLGAENIRTENRITIDRKAPNLLSLEVQAGNKERYKEGDILKVVGIFDENISRTAIIPTLQLVFSESGEAKGTLSSTVEGNIITYTYTIAKEDEGEISIKKWNGTVLDLAGNETVVNKKNVAGNGIIADNTAPEATIEFTTDNEKNVTAQISFNEENVIITNNDGKDTYLFTENGEFTFEFEDLAGNRASKKAVVTTIDKEAPIARVSWTINKDGTVTAKISFNEENVIITNNNGKDTYVFTKNGEFTFKFKDAAGNEGEETVKVDNMYNTEEQIPVIIFEELPVVQMGGTKYVKVPANMMTTSAIIEKMDKAALYGEKPEFTNLTADGKLKTGTEIKLNGETKYTVVINGDVNGDGEITFLGDIIFANNCRIGVVKLNNIQQLAADINNNGSIDFISDIIAMNNYRLGIIDSL